MENLKSIVLPLYQDTYGYARKCHTTEHRILINLTIWPQMSYYQSLKRK